MKAVVCEKYGSPDVLELTEVAKPTPRDDEVLIKVHATTVTVADVRVRSFTVPPSFWLPARVSLGITKPRNKILGAELAGEVVSVGKDVTRFKVGDQVCAANLDSFGGYAEYKCLPEEGPISIMPANLPYEHAAAIPIGARTALHYLKKANLQPGQSVLVYGASGSVGTYAVQLAKYFGAEVTGVCSTSNLELVKSLGADHVIDYTTSDFSRAGKQYDVIFVANNKCSFSACMRALAEKGIYLNITEPFPTLRMLWTKLTTDKVLMLGENPSRTADDLVTLNGLVGEGVIKPVIDRGYALEEIVEAHRYVEKGHKKGNVVVTVSHNGNGQRMLG
jgi:NADPH:quinone reductase-like Zn-dependent oxidoreductase